MSTRNTRAEYPPAWMDTARPAPSPEAVAAARSGAGAWKRATLAGWGVPWPPPKGWRSHLARLYRDQTAGRPAWETVTQHEGGESYVVRYGPASGGVSTVLEGDGPPVVLVDGYGNRPGEGVTMSVASARRLAADLGAVLHRLGPEF